MGCVAHWPLAKKSFTFGEIKTARTDQKKSNMPITSASSNQNAINYEI